MLIAGTDGSELSIEAVRTGLALLPPDEEILLVTVVEHGDPTLVAGTGMAGGVMTESEFEELDEAQMAAATTLLQSAAESLGLAAAKTVVLRGHAAQALCDLASERNARAIVLGTRGRGGVKRALLGSVSDHVVRNAPCPVVITRPPD
jgi:nucleotide-binding universal stress UspA family protein